MITARITIIALLLTFQQLGSMESRDLPTLKQLALVRAALFDEQFLKNKLPEKLETEIHELQKKVSCYYDILKAGDLFAGNTLKQLYKLNTSERNAIGITLASLFPEPTKNNIKRQFRLLAKYSCSEQAKQLVELVNQPDNKQLTDIVYMVKCLKKVKRVMLTDKLLVKGELIIGNTILLEASLALFNDKPYFQLKLEDSLLGLTGFLGKGETFKFFFDHGLSPNTMHLYKFRRTLLSRALQSNTLESVEVLLKQGADPNITVDSKSAPHLFNYIWMHDRKPESELVSGSSLLLKYGAQKTINFKDTYGKTVLDFVVESKRGQDLITLLVAHGAKHSSSLHNDIR